MSAPGHHKVLAIFLKLALVFTGFLLMFTLAVGQAASNQEGAVNILTRTEYLVREQQYYNQLITEAAKDAGVPKREINKLLLDPYQTRFLVDKSVNLVFQGRNTPLNPDDIYYISTYNFKYAKDLNSSERIQFQARIQLYEQNLYIMIRSMNKHHSLSGTLKLFWFLRDCIDKISSVLTLLIFFLFFCLCRIEGRERILFDSGLIIVAVAVLVLARAMISSISSTYVIEQNLSAEAETIALAVSRMTGMYLWIETFLLSFAGFALLLASADYPRNRK